MLLEPQHLADDLCEAVLRNDAQGLLFFHVRGRYTERVACRVVEGMDRYLAQAPLSMFADFGDVSSYESEARALMTKWCLDHRRAIRELHAFASNGLVRMGVATAAMTMSLVGLRLESHGSRAGFDACYDSRRFARAV